MEKWIFGLLFFRFKDSPINHQWKNGNTTIDIVLNIHVKKDKYRIKSVLKRRSKKPQQWRFEDTKVAEFD